MLLWVRNVGRAQLTTGHLVCSMRCWMGVPWWYSAGGQAALEGLRYLLPQQEA